MKLEKAEAGGEAGFSFSVLRPRPTPAILHFDIRGLTSALRPVLTQSLVPGSWFLVRGSGSGASDF